VAKGPLNKLTSYYYSFIFMYLFPLFVCSLLLQRIIAIFICFNFILNIINISLCLYYYYIINRNRDDVISSLLIGIGMTSLIGIGMTSFLVEWFSVYVVGSYAACANNESSEVYCL